MPAGVDWWSLLVDQKLLDRRFARNMLSWRHSGFSINNSVRILDRGVQRSLAEYVSRPAISLKKIRYEPFKGRVLFHTTYSDYFKENVHLFDPLDFLAELTQHIPPTRVQLIRRYGLCPTFYSGRHQVGRVKMTRMPPPHPTGPGAQRCPQRKTDAPDARERRHAWARLLARVYEVDALVCPRCGARFDRSDPESRANHKDPEPPGENPSGTAGTRSDHPRLNRLLGAE